MINDPLVMFGSIKVFDGLFIADEIAAGDLDFLSTNKVKKIINCSCEQIPNHWSAIGIEYLSFDWKEEYEIHVDEDTCNSIYDFIESGLAKTNSVLVHGVHNQCTSYLVISIYLMMKFKWSFEQTFEYMLTKQPNFYLVPHFVAIVKVVEEYLQLKYKDRPMTAEVRRTMESLKNKKQHEVDETKKDEILIWNTFINTHIAPGHTLQGVNHGHRPSGSITWRDEQPDLLSQGKYFHMLN